MLFSVIRIVKFVINLAFLLPLLFFFYWDLKEEGIFKRICRENLGDALDGELHVLGVPKGPIEGKVEKGRPFDGKDVLDKCRTVASKICTSFFKTRTSFCVLDGPFPSWVIVQLVVVFHTWKAHLTSY